MSRIDAVLEAARTRLPAVDAAGADGGDATVTVPEEGAFVQRSVADGAERSRVATSDDVPAGGRTAVLGPVLVYATDDEVTGYR